MNTNTRLRKRATAIAIIAIQLIFIFMSGMGSVYCVSSDSTKLRMDNPISHLHSHDKCAKSKCDRWDHGKEHHHGQCKDFRLDEFNQGNQTITSNELDEITDLAAVSIDIAPLTCDYRSISNDATPYLPATIKATTEERAGTILLN